MYLFCIFPELIHLGKAFDGGSSCSLAGRVQLTEISDKFLFKHQGETETSSLAAYIVDEINAVSGFLESDIRILFSGSAAAR